MCVLPAVDDHGPSVRKLGLFSVDLREEAQDAARLVGDAVVGPADVLVVPDDAAVFPLWERKRFQSFSADFGKEREGLGFRKVTCCTGNISRTRTL